MTNLNIQQGLNVEVVSTLIIKKLYDAAQSVPLPEEGEQDLANMSGNLLVDKTYRAQVSYLTTRFPDLHINVTDSYYIPFEDSNVQSVLMANNISSDGIGITETDASTANLGTMFSDNTTITSFDGFKYFTRANTSPANEMFKGCTNLSSIDLSNTTSIANGLFQNTALTTLSIPNLQTLSGKDQFNTCTKLTKVLNLGSIISIPIGAFFHCPLLTDVVLPESCTSIGLAAFADDSLLLNINLQNVTTIERDAFNSCSSLNTIDLRNVTSIDHLAFLHCTGLLGTIDLRNVVSIGSASFYHTNISGILNIPKLQSMSNYTFKNTKISGVECLGKVNKLEGTFRDCINLLYAKIPYECTTLDYDTFLGCNNVTSIKQYTDSIDNWIEGEEPTTGPLSRVTSFGINCFANCRQLLLTPLDIQNATTIGSRAFTGVSSLSGTLNLPNLTGTLGSNSFYATGISSISSLGSITEIREYAFESTNISSITIPNSVKKCYCNIVSDTPLQEIIFPEGVEEITGGLFLTKNNSLTYIEMPSTVTNMGYFFHRSLETSLDNLCTLIIKAITPPELNYYSSDEIDRTNGIKFAGIYVPDASLTAYQSATGAWQHSSIQAKLKPISQLQTDNPTAWTKYNRTSTV